MGISRVLRYKCWLVSFSGVTQGPKTNGYRTFGIIGCAPGDIPIEELGGSIGSIGRARQARD